MKFKKWCFEIVLDSPVLQTLCCLDAADAELFELDQRVRSDLREHMREHMGFGDVDTCVGNAIKEVYRDTGYDLAREERSIWEANKGVTRTEKEWNAYFKSLDVDPLTLICTPVATESRVVPKFAAACALHLRSKLGALQPTEANTLLVQRKYLELCRNRNVRECDTVLHQQFVMNAVFHEDVLDEIATVRRRAPGWVRWLNQVELARTINPTAC